MQQNKDRKSLSEINTYCQNTSVLLDIFTCLLGKFDFRYINTLLSGAKKRGVKGNDLFRPLFVLRFLDFSNIHRLMQSGFSIELSHRKDTLYEFLNNSYVPWRRVVQLFFKQVHNLILKNSDDSSEPKFFILDDSLLEKSGKTIEFIGKVFDHTSHTFRLGMKMLTLGYFDTKTFIPVDFSIHNEAGKKKNRGLKPKEIKAQFSKERDIESPGYERESEVSMDKITVALQMIKRSYKKWLKVDYVLADSWFICDKFITGIRKINRKLHVIGLMKTNRIILINGKPYKIDKVPEIKRKEIHHSRNFKCSYISSKISYKGISMRGYWIKMNGQNRWSLLISTNEKLSFTKAMQYYKNRWSIEVFFKDCKQNLGLQSCQSTSLDAHIATISVIFMNYMVLALKKRFEDYETFGILFRDFKELMLKDTIVKRIWEVLLHLLDDIFAFLDIDCDLFVKNLVNNQTEIMQKLKNALMPFYSLSYESIE